MPETLSRSDHLRLAALQAASRASSSDVPTSGLLSRAAQIETWLLTGVSVYTPIVGQQVGVEGLSVLVAGDRLNPQTAAALHEAAQAVLA